MSGFCGIRNVTLNVAKNLWMPQFYWAKLFLSGSFHYSFVQISSNMRLKWMTKDWPVASCFGWLPALIDSTGPVDYVSDHFRGMRVGRRFCAGYC